MEYGIKMIDNKWTQVIDGKIYPAFEADGCTCAEYVVNGVKFRYIYGMGYCVEVNGKMEKMPRIEEKEIQEEPKKETAKIVEELPTFTATVKNNELFICNNIKYVAKVRWEEIDDIDYGVMDKRIVDFIPIS